MHRGYAINVFRTQVGRLTHAFVHAFSMHVLTPPSSDAYVCLGTCFHARLLHTSCVCSTSCQRTTIGVIQGPLLICCDMTNRNAHTATVADFSK